jgi:hypothetical protein
MTKPFFGIILFIVGCSSGQRNQAHALNEDQSTQGNPAAFDTSAKTTMRVLTDKWQIIGIWASKNKEPLTVKITKDSIYFTEHFESYKYTLKGDSMFINYPDFLFAAKAYFNGDTLVMEAEHGKSKYVRFKQ